MSRLSRLAAVTVAAVIFAPVAGRSVSAQETVPATVDTIIIERSNVFDPEQAESNGFFRAMNSIHTVTSEQVILNYLQFEAGQPYDSAAVAESERQLRKTNLFRQLTMDSTRLEDGRLAVRVRSQDGWALKPKFALSIASTGDWTGTFGINDINLLGSGNQLFVAYQKELDRDGLNLSAQFERVFGWNFDAGANYAGLSDGKNGNWLVGLPFRNTESTKSYQWDGSLANQDVLQYRVSDVADSAVLDTTTYRRQAFVNTLKMGLATKSRIGDYLRFGADIGIREEEFYLDTASIGMVPDSVYGTVDGWTEFSKSRFRQYSRFNGFGTEDIDLSTTIRLTATLAPEGLGWQGTGMGLAVSAATGRADVFGGRGFLWASVDANYLWNAAVRDSGRVVFNVAGGIKPGERHAIAAQLQWGRLWNPKPGDQFDLGFDNAPRGWDAHSFVGDRAWWLQVEHRYYAVDAFLGVFGIGLGSFFDYGGAWYEDQAPRSGGSVGGGLRLGSAVGTVAVTSRIDLVYRFGEHATGGRWVVAFGSGFVFPRRTIPVINYRAQAPQ